MSFKKIRIFASQYRYRASSDKSIESLSTPNMALRHRAEPNVENNYFLADSDLAALKILIACSRIFNFSGDVGTI